MAYGRHWLMFWFFGVLATSCIGYSGDKMKTL